MPFLNSIEQIRAVEWSSEYLWDIQFQDINLPSPFNTWFPAIDVDEGVGNIDSYTWKANLSTFKIPQKTNSLNLKITFIDDANSTLINWLDNWINNRILNNGAYVSTLETIAQVVAIQRLDIQRNIVSQNNYQVYPEGEVVWGGSSESKTRQFTQNFVIVERMNPHTLSMTVAGT